MSEQVRRDEPNYQTHAALYSLLVRELRHAAVFLLDPDGRITSWNPGVENLLGFTEPEWVGQSGVIIFTEEDRASGAHLKEMECAAANGDAADIRWHLRKDGTRIFIDGLLQALRDQDGTLLGYAKLMNDATDRQIAQESLYSMLESISDAFYAVDGEFRFTYVNRKAEEWWGRSRAELLGRHYWTEFPRAVGSFSYEMHLKAMAERRPVQYETVSPLIARWVDVSIYPDARGGLSCYFRDIEGRKQDEEQLLQLTQALNQTQVLVRSVDGAIRFWSAGCQRLYGYTPEEAVGRCAQDLLHTDFPEPRDRIHEQLLSTGHWQGELCQQRRDGSSLTCASDWILHRGRGGKAVSIIEAHTDITPQKQVQSELHRANEELRHFSHIVSHDLQAPLRMVRSYAELMSRRYHSRLDQTANEFLQFIMQGAVSMETLIRTLLQYAQAAEQPLRKQPVAVATALNAVLVMLQPAISETGGTVMFDSLPTVQADPVQLQQVLQNLIGNALKYRKPGIAPCVRVQAETRRSEWLFRVADNGIGIEPKYRDHIFEPLKRLHGSEIQGTGIGLAVCKRIVERHGGRIWVESEPKKGSTFLFTLPRP